MKNNLAIDKDIIRSFGRINGRKLREQQAYLVENLLPELSIELSKEETGVIFATPFPNVLSSPLFLEIGFGYGEHLVAMAEKYPLVNFIGCETFINGVATLLKQIDDRKVANIRILHGDARLLIDKLPNASLDRLFILFPDPWPKTKQQKKRLISTEMLQKLARVMRPGGRLEVATDHAEYGKWIEKVLCEAELFLENKTLGSNAIPEDWSETRYQQKAKKQGRDARFFNYVRG